MTEKAACAYCGGPIHRSNDPNVPWVHDASNNACCDVTTPEDAVRLAGTPGRPEARPAAVFTVSQGADDGEPWLRVDTAAGVSVIVRPKGAGAIVDVDPQRSDVPFAVYVMDAPVFTGTGLGEPT